MGMVDHEPLSGLTPAFAAIIMIRERHLHFQRRLRLLHEYAPLGRVIGSLYISMIPRLSQKPRKASLASDPWHGLLGCMSEWGQVTYNFFHDHFGILAFSSARSDFGRLDGSHESYALQCFIPVAESRPLGAWPTNHYSRQRRLLSIDRPTRQPTVGVVISQQDLAGRIFTSSSLNRAKRVVRGPMSRHRPVF